MLAQRTLLRAGSRFSSPALRQTVQRRLASSSDNAFVREREAVRHHAAATTGMWLKISVFGIPPFLAIASYNAWSLWNEHWEHWSHMPPLEERVEYPYQNIRSKNYPWGDGGKTLFWNEQVNYHNKDKTT
ncbi:Cytochrome c oxidase subunit VIa [Microdochium nivale]|nr:Cytochrome c oxidase subunit VIa [Microdochium nivale]